MNSFAGALSRAFTRLYSTSARNVIHNIPKSQFEVVFPDGETAFLRYEKVGQNIEMNQTVVPSSMRGQGIAEELAHHAFAFVKESESKAVVNCSYLRDKYLPKHTEWKDVVKL